MCECDYMKTILTYMIARGLLRPKTYVYPPQHLCKDQIYDWTTKNTNKSSDANRNGKVKTKLPLDEVVT